MHAPNAMVNADTEWTTYKLDDLGQYQLFLYMDSEHCSSFKTQALWQMCKSGYSKKPPGHLRMKKLSCLTCWSCYSSILENFCPTVQNTCHNVLDKEGYLG